MKRLIRASTLFTAKNLTVNKVKLIFNLYMYLCYQGGVPPDWNALDPSKMESILACSDDPHYAPSQSVC